MHNDLRLATGGREARLPGGEDRKNVKPGGCARSAILAFQGFIAAYRLSFANE
jgi:hypothetical protein